MPDLGASGGNRGSISFSDGSFSMGSSQNLTGNLGHDPKDVTHLLVLVLIFYCGRTRFT